MPDENLTRVATELYGLNPEEFTRARDERATRIRAGGDRDLAQRVRRLRRPATAAWVVNLLVRRHGAEMDQLLEVGRALREAQAGPDPAGLRELNRQRHQVVTAVTRRARELAEREGRPIGEPIAIQVEQTLRAAMADPGAADAVRSGTLTAPLAATGLAPAGLAGAVAVPADPTAGRRERRTARAAGPAREPDHGRKSGRREAAVAVRRAEDTARKAGRKAVAAAVRRAEDTARDAEAALESAQAGAEGAAARRDELTARLADLRRALGALEQEAAVADREARMAQRRRDDAARAAIRARHAADAAPGGPPGP